VLVWKASFDYGHMFLSNLGNDQYSLCQTKRNLIINEIIEQML